MNVVSPSKESAGQNVNAWSTARRHVVQSATQKICHNAIDSPPLASAVLSFSSIQTLQQQICDLQSKNNLNCLPRTPSVPVITFGQNTWTNVNKSPAMQADVSPPSRPTKHGWGLAGKGIFDEIQVVPIQKPLHSSPYDSLTFEPSSFPSPIVLSQTSVPSSRSNHLESVKMGNSSTGNKHNTSCVESENKFAVVTNIVQSSNLQDIQSQELAAQLALEEINERKAAEELAKKLEEDEIKQQIEQIELQYRKIERGKRGRCKGGRNS
jgi:hypothetical protein